MAINLATEGSGELGRKCFVSDVIAGALQFQFTGGVAITQNDQQLAILFKEGRPVHASGPLVPHFRLGEVLLGDGVALQSQVASALTQLEAMVGSKPLSGALLVKEGLDPAEVKRAVQQQTRLRIKAVLALESGEWRAAAGENARMREVGVRTDSLPMLLQDLPEVACARELKWAADKWLGKAVQLRAGGPGPLADQPFDRAVSAILRFLEKPRKPDQLERATGNRRVVRLVLRLLDLLGRLEAHPLAKSVPIARATLLKGQSITSYSSPDTAAAAPTAQPEEEITEPEGPPKPPPLSARDQQKAEEIQKRHEKIGKQNHFEVLGLKQDCKGAEVKEAAKTLLGRFHPDKLPNTIPEDVRKLAGELTARINEASTALSGDEARRKYLELLNDERIRGDIRRAELVKDAETKAQMGVVMLRKRDFQQARELFRYCVDADPVTAIYKAHLAFAMHADRNFDREEAFEKGYALLLEALKAAGDRDATVHYYTGLLLKERERLKEALHHFKAAAQIDPKNVDMKREVRLLQGRLEKDKEDAKQKTGGLSRFLKR